MNYKILLLFGLIVVMFSIMFTSTGEAFQTSAKELEEIQEQQMVPAPANVVPPSSDVMDVTTDIPPDTVLEESPGNATARAAVLNPNAIALPEQANVYWKVKDAKDLNKCKINRNGNGGIFHVNCVDRDTGAPSELCKDMAFNEVTMSEPPLRGPGGNRTLMEVYYKKSKCDGRWDIRNVVDKGCLPGKIGRQVEIQCRLPTREGEKIGLGVHGCRNMKRQPIDGKDMLTDPVQTVNRDSSWSSATLDDQACRPTWDFSKRVDKGCRGQKSGKVFHIPCNIADGSLSVGCKNMERQSMDGRDMLMNPVRNPEGNNAYTKVVVDDKACSIKWDFGALKKLSCRKDKPGMVYEATCLRPDGSKSLGCSDISPELEINGKRQLVPASRSVEDAAISRIVVDAANCTPRWSWAKREKGPCVKGGFRSWTIPCTDGEGRLSAGCNDSVNPAFVNKMKQDGIQFVNAKRRDFKTMDVFSKDKICEPKWITSEKKAGIECKFGGRPYTVPCRNFEGKFSNKCADMQQTTGMVHAPKRLTPYRSEIYLKNKQCEVETKFLVANSSLMKRDPRWEIPNEIRKDYRDLRLQQFKKVMSNRTIS